MKKNIVLGLLAVTMSLSMGMTAFAAGWQRNDTGWWYATNDEGTSWHANGWQWIDGNGDGTAECYYFDGNGYMLSNTTTPDNYQVNADGAWTVNGQVQVKQVGYQQPAGTETGTAKSAEEILDYLVNRDDGLCPLEIDYSGPPVASGATNLKHWGTAKNCWTWICCKGVPGASVYCPIALDENGYLLVNTTTPDGLYVNEYGILEIDGVEVVHANRCYNFPWKNDTKDIYGNVINKNNCDLSKIDLRNSKHPVSSDSGDMIPFGKLMYMHVEHQGSDGKYYFELGYNYCVQAAKDLWPNTYGKDVGPEPKTYRK